MRLYLDGELVQEQVIPASLAASGGFRGSFTTRDDRLTFTMVSFRSLSFSTGNGTVAFDNAQISPDPLDE